MVSVYAVGVASGGYPFGSARMGNGACFRGGSREGLVPLDQGRREGLRVPAWMQRRFGERLLRARRWPLHAV